MMGAHRCAVVLVVGVMLGGVLGGCQEDLGPGPEVELVADLEGTWSGSFLVGPITVTFTVCAVGEECGRLESVNLQCVHALVYQSEDVDGFNFEADPGHGLQCNRSPWANGVMHVTPEAGDSLFILMLPMPGSDELTELRRVKG